MQLAATRLVGGGGSQEGEYEIPLLNVSLVPFCTSRKEPPGGCRRIRADEGSVARRPPFGAQPPHSGGTWRGDRPLRVHNARRPASSQTPVHSVRLFGEHPFSSVARPFPDKPACAGPCPGSLLGAGVRSAARSSPRPRSGPSALRITAQRLNALTLRGLRDAVTAHHSAKNAAPPSASPVFSPARFRGPRRNPAQRVRWGEEPQRRKRVLALAWERAFHSLRRRCRCSRPLRA